MSAWIAFLPIVGCLVYFVGVVAHTLYQWARVAARDATTEET